MSALAEAVQSKATMLKYVPEGPAAETYISLVDMIAEKYGMDRSKIYDGGQGKSGDAASIARRLIVLMLREPPWQYSYPAIGLAMNRNHTSVMRLCNKDKEIVQSELLERVRFENAALRLLSAEKMLEDLDQIFVKCAGVSPPDQDRTLVSGISDSADLKDVDARYYRKVVVLMRESAAEQRMAIWEQACERLFPNTRASAAACLPREFRTD